MTHPSCAAPRQQPIRTRLGALLREPLCQFLLLGGMIFALDAGLNPAAEANRIEVSNGDLQRLRALAVKQWGSEPDAAQLRRLVDEHIREEVLYREALANGLERDDVVVRRRLAQKMEFLAQADVRLPSDDEVMAFYQANLARYSAPAELTFRQLYFEPQGEAASRVVQTLAALRENPQQPLKGDPLPLAERFVGQSLLTVARDFGEDFSRQLFELPAGQWQGPVRSAYGLHLVYIERHAQPQALPLAAVRVRVAADLAREHQQLARDAAYQTLLARYQVQVVRIADGDEVAAQ